jgi:hypothetical protein
MHFMQDVETGIVKATVENPRGSVEKLSPKECRGCQHCAKGQCEGSRGIFRGQTQGFKIEGAQPRGFAAKGLPEENPEGALTQPRSTV